MGGSAVLRMSDRISSSLFVWLVLSWTGSVMTSIPIVTWHGLGGTQSECDRMIDTIRESIPDVHILNVAVGSTPDLDHANTILMNAMIRLTLCVR